jgi:hypothetical protein
MGSHVLFNPGGGSVNYRLMYWFTSWIVNPTAENLRNCLACLAEMKSEGHLTLRGPRGVACEAGSPKMHWTFNVGAVVGGLLWAIRRRCQPLIDACIGFLEDEVGLDLDFRYNDVVAMPCPRLVAGDDDTRDEEQAPIDGYRDAFVSLAIGEKVKKADHYWSQPNAIAVWAMREVMKLMPELGERFKGAQRPHLYLPIEKTATPDGGYEARIADTPEARAVMGKDCCQAVSNGRAGVTYMVDWQERWLRPGGKAA